MNSGLRRWQAERRREREQWEKELARAAKKNQAFMWKNARQFAHDEDLRIAAQKAAQGAKRRAAKMQRLPPWADRRAIAQVYAEARRLTQESGIEHHVDHCVPLQGRRVSGLHVHNNLQILPAAENLKKHNRFEIQP